jgi:hypothetical protein
LQQHLNETLEVLSTRHRLEAVLRRAPSACVRGGPQFVARLRAGNVSLGLENRVDLLATEAEVLGDRRNAIARTCGLRDEPIAGAYVVASRGRKGERRRWRSCTIGVGRLIWRGHRR